MSDRHFSTEHLQVGIGARAIRGGAIAVGSQGARLLVNTAGTVVLARLLAPGDYGLIGMVTVVTGFLMMFKDIGLSQATVQRAELTHEQTSNLFWVNVAGSAIVALLAMAIAPLVARFYGEPRLTHIMLVLSTGFVLGGLSVQHEALLRRQMRFGALAVANVASVSCGVIVGIVLALHGARYWALVGQQIAMALTNTVAVWMFCGWRPGWPTRRSRTRDMLIFGGNVTGFNVLNYFARNGDNLLIGRVWGSQALGYYANAYQLLLLPLTQINTPVSAVLLPTLSRLVSDPERYRSAFCRSLEKVVMITMPGVALLLVTSDWVIATILGPQWAPSARILMWLAVAGLVQPVGNTTSWLYISQNRTSQLLRWGGIGSGITILSIIAGLPWGPVGVAISYALIGVLVRTPLNLWYVGREGPVRTMDYYRTVLPFGLAALCCGLAVLAYRYLARPASPELGLAVSVGIACVVTTIVLMLTRVGRAALRDMIVAAGRLLPMRVVTS